MATSHLIRTAVLLGAVVTGVALLSGLVVEGQLTRSRLLFAVLLGVSVALAYAALRSHDRR